MVQRNGSGDDDPTRIGAVRPAGAAGPLEPARGPEGAEAVSSVETDTGVGAVARALEAGEITPAEARDRLIAEALRAQLPPDVDPALAAELRAEIEAVLDADPTLARLLGSGAA